MQDRVDELRETLAAAQRQALQVEGPAAAARGSVVLALHQVAAMLEELGARSPGAEAPLSPSDSPAGRRRRRGASERRNVRTSKRRKVEGQGRGSALGLS